MHERTGTDHRCPRGRLRASRVCLSSAIAALMVVAWNGERAAFAAPIKVACIGEHTTHSHHFPPLNRDTQPVATQEYPAMLQTLLGTGYQVRNFGDCCGTVLQGYTPAETHPYVLGALSAAEGPGYNESIAFLPDVVVIGSWGRHDWGLAQAPASTWNLAKFETDYDDLVQRYQRLASHPIIFVSLPIPIPYGQAAPATGVATSSVLPAVRNIANKYHLPIVDLYNPFLGHRELFKQPPDTEGEGEHVTDGPGLHAIADAVYAAIAAYQADGGVVGDASASDRDARSLADAGEERPAIEQDSSSLGDGATAADASTVTAGSGGSGAGGTSGSTVTGALAGSGGSSNAGGTNAGGSPASPGDAKADSGCACSSVDRGPSTVRWFAFPLAGLLLFAERRRSMRRLRGRVRCCEGS
jgi:acyl-CoA thioesterase-1